MISDTFIKNAFSLMSLFFFLSAGLCAQTIHHTPDIKPEKEFDNIHVKKIKSDEHSTSFIIWVKEKVKAHKHEKHSETLYVLKGKGEMKIDGSTFAVGPGDLFNIPVNTVHSVITTSEEPLKVISLQAPEFMGDDRVFVK